MHAGVMMVGGAAFVLLEFALLGGPMLLVDWSRKRLAATVERQIALTDALDGQLGAVVSPVVTKPLFGPWEIQIGVPLSRVTAVGRILAIVNAVLSSVGGMGEKSYRVVLRATEDTQREARAPQARQSVLGAPCCGSATGW